MKTMTRINLFSFISFYLSPCFPHSLFSPSFSLLFIPVQNIFPSLHSSLSFPPSPFLSFSFPFSYFLTICHSIYSMNHAFFRFPPLSFLNLPTFLSTCTCTYTESRFPCHKTRNHEGHEAHEMTRCMAGSFSRREMVGSNANSIPKKSKKLFFGFLSKRKGMKSFR